MIAILVSTAHGAPVTATYCFRYENMGEFIDHQFGVGSNFTSLNEKARGIKVEFVPQGSGATETEYALNGPTNDGCATVTLDNALHYDIWVHLESQRANGTIVKALEKSGNNWVVKKFLMTSAIGHVPANGQTYGPTGWAQRLSGNNALVRLHAAANHATLRWDLGIAGGVVELETDSTSTTCSSADVSCYKPSTNRIHISSSVAHNDSLQQARIAHEVGHAMWNHRNGDQGWLVNSNVDPNACGPNLADHYDWNTKEWQSIAVIESLAWFYSAVAFNDDGRTSASCTGRTRSSTGTDRAGTT